MRTHIAGAFAALALAPSAALAEPAAPGAPTAPPQPAATPTTTVLDATFAFYPAAARAAGLDGEATIRCGRNANLALKDCTLVSESPAAEGFGAAALAMAAKSPDNPKLNVAEAALLVPAPITVHFRLHPPQIDPDLTEMAHVEKPPQIVNRPSPAVMALYYPDRPARSGIGGSAQIHCHVTREGRLVKCATVQETPPGEDFGAAASLVAEREYRMAPMLYDGQPSDDGEADLTIAFAPRHGPAPPVAAAPQASRPSPPADASADIQKPDWARTPSGADFASLYPSDAAGAGVSGAVVLRCKVGAHGDLDPCQVLLEQPSGQGFGRAALRLAARFQMKPQDRDGAPTAGRSVEVPVRFLP